MSKLPDAPFSEIAVNLQGAAAGARIAIGYAQHEPWAQGVGVQAEIASWSRDARAADILSDLFEALAPHEELVRDFVAGLVAVGEKKRSVG